MVRFEIRRGGEPQGWFETRATPVFVGRDPTMDLVLDDPMVSRQHAVVISRGPGFVIQDVGGRNPLRVNGRAVVSHSLRSGDVVSLGNVELVFRPAKSKRDAATLAAAQESTLDEGPTVVKARDAVPGFGGVERSRVGEDTSSDGMEVEAVGGDARSQRSLRILQDFSELIVSFSDRQKLVEAALATVFDTLEVRHGVIGFFSDDGQLDIRVERGKRDVETSRAGTGSPDQRTIIERVRRDAVAILVPESGLEKEGGAHGNVAGAMCLPLFRSEDVCGILLVDSQERSQGFDQEDLYFANILSHMISLALEKEELYEQIHEENIELKNILQQKNRLVGASRALKEVYRKTKRVASFDTTVLITGESGTGKELVARAIHDRSPRRGKPFIAVNCAAIPETLLESELFGYDPQSGISGADPNGKPGKFELADGGTLFLDEIGDMSLSTQAKILRVLEERIVDRLGATEGTRVDLRIIAATNKILSDAVAENGFREDLYYRLRVFQIDLPPLRERREDILPLAVHFLSMHRAEDRPVVELSPRTKEILLAYHWPGNVRELKHCIEEALLMSNGRSIYPENLPRDLRREDNPPPFGTLAEVEAQHIRRVLQSANWNKRRAAEMLGINRSTLYEKIRLYDIARPEEGNRKSRRVVVAAEGRNGKGTRPNGNGESDAN